MTIMIFFIKKAPFKFFSATAYCRQYNTTFLHLQDQIRAGTNFFKTFFTAKTEKSRNKSQTKSISIGQTAAYIVFLPALFIYCLPYIFRCAVCTSVPKSYSCFQSRRQDGQVGSLADSRLCQAKAMLRWLRLRTVTDRYGYLRTLQEFEVLPIGQNL